MKPFCVGDVRGRGVLCVIPKKLGNHVQFCFYFNIKLFKVRGELKLIIKVSGVP